MYVRQALRGSNSWAIKQMQPVQFCICKSQSEDAHEEAEWVYIYAVGARHALRGGNCGGAIKRALGGHSNTFAVSHEAGTTPDTRFYSTFGFSLS